MISRRYHHLLGFHCVWEMSIQNWRSGKLFQHRRPATTTTKSCLRGQGNKTKTAPTGSKVLQQGGHAERLVGMYLSWTVLPYCLFATATGQFGLYHSNKETFSSSTTAFYLVSDRRSTAGFHSDDRRCCIDTRMEVVARTRTVLLFPKLADLSFYIHTITTVTTTTRFGHCRDRRSRGRAFTCV